MELMPTSVSHWHLVLNHFPSVGTIIAVCLLLGARFLGSKDLTRAGLLLLVVLGLVSIPVFITGGAAQFQIDELPGYSETAVLAHEDAALLALLAMSLTGMLAWLVLWLDRRKPALDGVMPLAVLAVGAVTVLLMLWTASLGGKIGHEEVRLGAPAAGSGLTAYLIQWSYDDQIGWLPVTMRWPTMEAIHFLGMALLFGPLLLTALRLIGVARQIPYAALHRLLPFGVLGFALNVATGILFFIMNASRYAAITYGFYPKMALIVVGGLAVVYLTIFERPWRLAPGEDAPVGAKLVAVGTVATWVLVIAFGRLLPYLEGGGGL
jgi:uncharacterized membrane protein